MSEIEKEYREDVREEKSIMVVAKRNANALGAELSKQESDSLYYRSYLVTDTSIDSLTPRPFLLYRSDPSLVKCFVNRTPISPDIMKDFTYYYSVIQFQFVTALYEMAQRLEKINSVGPDVAGYVMVSTGGFSKYLYDNTQRFGDFDFQIMPHYNGHLLNKHVHYKYIRANLKLKLITSILEVCNYINNRFIPRYINNHLTDNSPVSNSLRKILESYRIAIHFSHNMTPITTPGTTEHREGKMMIILSNKYSFKNSFPRFIKIKLVDFVFDYDYVMPHYENLKSMSPFVVKAVYPLMKLVNEEGYVAFKTYNPKDIIKEKQNIMNMNHSSTYLHQKANEDQKFWKQFV